MHELPVNQVESINPPATQSKNCGVHDSLTGSHEHGGWNFFSINMTSGFIKLHRKIKDWDWYRDSQTLHLFVHFLISANFKDSDFMGLRIKRGQLICGRKKLSEDTGISEQSIRTSMERLKSTKEITSQSTSKFSIITVCNYEKYQDVINDINQPINQPINQHSTSIQPAFNQHLTTSEELKNIRIKERKNNTVIFSIPSISEIESYCKERHNNIDAQAFHDFYTSKGWKIGNTPMKDWRAAVRTWERKDKENEEKDTRPAWKRGVLG